MQERKKRTDVDDLFIKGNASQVGSGACDARGEGGARV